MSLDVSPRNWKTNTQHDIFTDRGNLSSLRKFQRSRLLVDGKEVEGRLSVFDSYFIVTKEFPDIRWQGIQKAAIVNRDRSGFRDLFFEAVAPNRAFSII